MEEILITYIKNLDEYNKYSDDEKIDFLENLFKEFVNSKSEILKKRKNHLDLELYITIHKESILYSRNLTLKNSKNYDIDCALNFFNDKKNIDNNIKIIQEIIKLKENIPEGILTDEDNEVLKDIKIAEFILKFYKDNNIKLDSQLSEDQFRILLGQIDKFDSDFKKRAYALLIETKTNKDGKEIQYFKGNNKVNSHFHPLYEKLITREFKGIHHSSLFKLKESAMPINEKYKNILNDMLSDLKNFNTIFQDDEFLQKILQKDIVNLNDFEKLHVLKKYTILTEKIIRGGIQANPQALNGLGPFLLISIHNKEPTIIRNLKDYPDPAEVNTTYVFEEPDSKKKLAIKKWEDVKITDIVPALQRKDFRSIIEKNTIDLLDELEKDESIINLNKEDLKFIYSNLPHSEKEKIKKLLAEAGNEIGDDESIKKQIIQAYRKMLFLRFETVKLKGEEGVKIGILKIGDINILQKLKGTNIELSSTDFESWGTIKFGNKFCAFDEEAIRTNNPIPSDILFKFLGFNESDLKKFSALN